MIDEPNRTQDYAPKTTPALHWQLRDRTMVLGRRPLLMAILNVTPDSFSDGGRYASIDAAIAHGLGCLQQGADILDIGGESTRPGAVSVSADEELRRVLPVVTALAQQTELPISIDTSKAAVAKACLAVGAAIVNDVTALAGDPDMPAVVAESRAGIILMHMLGTPQTMQKNPQYGDVVDDIARFLENRLQLCVASGIATENIALDPGIGFGKTVEHNLELLARLAEFQRFRRPVCLGVSRKGFLSRLLGERPVGRRLASSLAAVCHALGQGAVQIVRVHDVEETHDAVNVFMSIEERRGQFGGADVE